jgi:predicted nucleotidyltransferase
VIEVTSDDLPASDKITIDGKSREQTSIIEIQPKGSYLKIDDEGYVINPASPEKIQEKWKPVIDDVLQAYKDQYGDKLKGVYIRGSVAKGEAIENISDIDTFAYVDIPKEEIDSAWTSPVKERLKENYPFVKGFEADAFPLSDTETNEDQIFLLQSLCVYGDKIEIRKMKPGKDMIFHFPMTEKRMLGFQNRIDRVVSQEKAKSDCTWIMKNILRTGFELTMERSHKYTRDLYLCYKDFSDYYPELEPEMKEVLFLALNPTTDKEKVRATMLAIVPWMIEKCSKQTY